MNAFTIAKRIIKQLLGDKRTLALLFVAPVIVLFLLSHILNTTSYRPIIDVYQVKQDFIKDLQKEAQVHISTDLALSRAAVENKSIDGLIDGSNGYTIIVEGTDPSVTKGVKMAVSMALSDQMQTNFTSIKSLLAQIPGKSSAFPDASQMNPEYVYLYGSEDLSSFDNLAAVFMGFFIFFFVFLISGIAFLREKISGTLERLLATPVKRLEIVWGYFLGFGLFVILQTLVIQLYTIYGLNIEFKGSFWLVLLINCLLAAGSLSLGTLLSAFAHNEFQIIQFIPLVVVPQVLLCGIFSLQGMPAWILFLSKIFPLTYAADALRQVALKSSSLSTVAPQLLVLLGFALLFIILNAVVLKRYRRI